MDDALPLTPVLLGVVGALLLVVGRRIYWFFVAAVGFFSGYVLGDQLFPELPDPWLLLASLVVGLLGALIARFLQRLAVMLAGGAVGGLIAFRLAPEVGLHTPAGMVVACVTGALLIAVFVTVLFDPALIIMSSLAGGVMIVQAVGLAAELIFPAVLVLAVLGIAFQFWMMRHHRTVPPPPAG